MGAGAGPWSRGPHSAAGRSLPGSRARLAPPRPRGPHSTCRVSRFTPLLPLVTTPGQPEDVTTGRLAGKRTGCAVHGRRAPCPPRRRGPAPFHEEPLPVAGATCRPRPVTEFPGSSAHVSARRAGPGPSGLRTPTPSRGRAVPPPGCAVSQVNDVSTRIAWSRSHLPVTHGVARLAIGSLAMRGERREGNEVGGGQEERAPGAPGAAVSAVTM